MFEKKKDKVLKKEAKRKELLLRPRVCERRGQRSNRTVDPNRRLEHGLFHFLLVLRDLGLEPATPDSGLFS